MFSHMVFDDLHPHTYMCSGKFMGVVAHPASVHPRPTSSGRIITWHREGIALEQALSGQVFIDGLVLKCFVLSLIVPLGQSLRWIIAEP